MRSRVSTKPTAMPDPATIATDDELLATAAGAALNVVAVLVMLVVNVVLEVVVWVDVIVVVTQGSKQTHFNK